MILQFHGNQSDSHMLQTVHATLRASLLQLQSRTPHFSQKVLAELKLQSKPVIMYTDNKSTIALTFRNPSSKLSRHFDISCAINQEAVDNGTIDLRYTPSSDNIADGFTKPLTPTKVDNWAKKLVISH